MSAASMIAVAAWTLGNGVRGILWHQLTDLEHDRYAGVRTFAQRHAPAVAVRLGTFVAFPVETAGLGWMLWQMRSAGPVVALVAYATVTALRMWHWRINAVIVAPKPRFLIVLHEYYDAWLPIAVLLAAGWRHPADLFVLAVHLALFPTRTWQAVRDGGRLGRELWGRVVG